MDRIFRLDKDVKIHKASMIIGLSGWVNAGEVSTLSVKYLIDKLNAEKVGEIQSGKFYVYQIQRPLVAIKKGLVQDYLSFSNDIFCWRNEKKDVGLIFLLGAEPHLDWAAYSRAVLDVAEKLGVSRIYTLGGYLVDVSPVSKPFVTGSSSNGEILAELRDVGLELVDYSGPTSVYSDIHWRAKSRNLDVVSLWCAVPFYGKGPNPRAAYSLMLKLTSLLDLKLELRDLKKKADSFTARVSDEIKKRMRRPTGDSEKRPSFFI